MVLLATLQFLYDEKSQEIFPSTWVVLQLYSPVVQGKVFLNLNSSNPTEELYIENQQADSSDLGDVIKQFHMQKSQKKKFYHIEITSCNIL